MGRWNRKVERAQKAAEPGESSHCHLWVATLRNKSLLLFQCLCCEASNKQISNKLTPRLMFPRKSILLLSVLPTAWSLDLVCKFPFSYLPFTELFPSFSLQFSSTLLLPRPWSPSMCSSMMYRTKQFLFGLSPYQFAFPLKIVVKMDVFSVTLLRTSSHFTLSDHFIFFYSSPAPNFKTFQIFPLFLS